MTALESSGDGAGPVSSMGRSSTVAMLVATVVMGLSGLVVLLVTAVSFSASDYALFGVFWAALYFLVVVMTGVQQESTRASLAPRDGQTTSLGRFAVLLSAGLFVVIAGSSVWWSEPAFGPHRHTLAVLVGAGAAGYALNCVFAGMLAGAGRWRRLAALLVVEGVLRGGGMCVALVITHSVELAAWVVVLTYPVTLVAVGTGAGRAVVGRLRVAGTMRQLCSNTAQTMVGAAGVGALVTGFPFFMAVLARDESSATVGALTLALMLTRAPLLVPLMGVQSMLVTAFVAKESPWRLLRSMLLLTTAAGGVLSIAAGTIGPKVLGFAFGDDFAVRGLILFLLVASATCLAAMTLVTPALVAGSTFTANAIAWLVATGIAVGVLAAAPWSLEWRTVAALLAGPLAGLAVQLLSLRSVTESNNR